MGEPFLLHELRAMQAGHRAEPERFRGQYVPYQRRGVLSIPAFKLPAGGDPAVEGRAASLKLMGAAAKVAADMFFFDLEDAAPDHPAFKQWARQFCIEALLAHDFGQRVVAFRPNNLRTDFFEDDLVGVMRAAGHKLHAIVLPKSESAAEVADVARIVQQLARLYALPRVPALEVLIESPRAFAEAQAIAAVPGVAALAFGAFDFARGIGSSVDAERWLQDQLAVRQLLPVLAAAEGKEAVDAVTATLPIRPAKPLDMAQDRFERALSGDVGGLDSALVAMIERRNHALWLAKRDAEDARRLGYAGKWILHPDQIAPIQAAFTPTRPEALAALQLAADYATAHARGSGAELSGGNVMADKAVVGAQWWTVEAALRAQVLTEADVAGTGLTLAVLRRTVVTRADQQAAG